MSNSHVDDGLLLRAIDQELSPRHATQVKLHIEQCASCRERFRRLERITARIAEYGHDMPEAGATTALAEATVSGASGPGAQPAPPVAQLAAISSSGAPAASSMARRVVRSVCRSLSRGFDGPGLMDAASAPGSNAGHVVPAG